MPQTKKTEKAKRYCALVNSGKIGQRLKDSLNSTEFECLGIFIINKATFQRLENLPVMPEILFLEYCKESKEIELLIKQNYSKTSIVYLQPKELCVESKINDLFTGNIVVIV